MLKGLDMFILPSYSAKGFCVPPFKLTSTHIDKEVSLPLRKEEQHYFVSITLS